MGAGVRAVRPGVRGAAAASRADTTAAILSAERMDAHTAALADPAPSGRLVGAH
ncbi:hypothetical protein HET64_36860 [Streptomyces sp. McG3]|nr:hypothetical protein [Streptomyces sp. McG3]